MLFGLEEQNFKKLEQFYRVDVNIVPVKKMKLDKIEVRILKMDQDFVGNKKKSSSV